MAISLASIERGAALKAPKLAIYGVPGIGKTTFACSAPKPIVIQTEEGLGMLDVPRFPLAQTYQDVLDAIGSLYQEEHDFQSVILDSADRLEPMLWDYTVQTYRTDKGETHIEGFGYGKGYTYAAEVWRTLLAGFDALRDRGMCVIVIAHADVKRFESPEHEPFDRYQMRLHKTANELVCDWTDVLLFANYKVHVVRDKAKFDKEGRARGAGRGERVIYTEERPAYRAKNRFSLPPELPLDWNAFTEALSTSLDGHQNPNPTNNNNTEENESN